VKTNLLVFAVIHVWQSLRHETASVVIPTSKTNSKQNLSTFVDKCQVNSLLLPQKTVAKTTIYTAASCTITCCDSAQILMTATVNAVSLGAAVSFSCQGQLTPTFIQLVEQIRNITTQNCIKIRTVALKL